MGARVRYARPGARAVRVGVWLCGLRGDCGREARVTWGGRPGDVASAGPGRPTHATREGKGVRVAWGGF